MMMLAGIQKDCNQTPMPQDGGEYILMETYVDGPEQWNCVGCTTFVDHYNGHIESWHHLKMLHHHGIPTPWPWAQRMLRDKGWAELEPAAAAEDWFERQQREMMQRAQMPRPRIPGPPPGIRPCDDMGVPPPPPRYGAAAASAAEGSGAAAASAAEGSGAPAAAALGHVPSGGTTLCLKSEIAALTVEIERHNSEVAGLVRGMGRMAVQIDEMTVQIERQAEVIERLIAALEQHDTAAAAGRQTGVPSQSGGDITRREAYVSSSSEGFLECTRPGPDSSSVLREHCRKRTRTAAKRAAADVVSWNTFGKHSENQASAG